MVNHLRPFPEASVGPEWQEQTVRAVGGQGELHEVTQHLNKLETWLFLNPRFLVMPNHWCQLELSPDPEFPRTEKVASSLYERDDLS